MSPSTRPTPTKGRTATRSPPQDLSEITVTVTSADGSRTKSYRVAFGDAGQEPTPEPWAHCLRGEIAEGFSLVVSEGGSVEDLVACAESRGVTALYALHEGVYVSYILGAPEWVNAGFAGLFAGGVPAFTPLTVQSKGPPSADPNRGDGALLPGAECLRGEIAVGFSLVVSRGRQRRGPRGLCGEPGCRDPLRAARGCLRLLHHRRARSG